MTLEPDTHLGDGRYRLRRRLGAGGMASVWLAEDQRLHRPVAVKIVADTLAGDEQWTRRFRREARAAAALAHRGVVSVFDYGVEDGRPYLVMEYVPGGTLGERLNGKGDPPEPPAVARELLEALGAVHAAGILHRDVKPANLLLDEHGHVRLTDFGIALPEDASVLTRTGLVVGTLKYLAPEVARGERATVQSDLYAAGAVIEQVKAQRPAPELDALVATLTDEDPARRPASAAAALALLPDAGPGQSAARGGTTSATEALTAPTEAVTAATGATRRLPAGRVRAATRRLPAERFPNPTPLAAAYAAAAVVLVAIIVIALVSGGSGPKPSAVPQPAPVHASVSRQVQALERIVDHAATP